MSGGIIQNISQRIKGLDTRALAVTIVALVGILGFGLGRLSAVETKSEARLVETSQTAQAPIAVGGRVVGSKSGSKYHFPWCPGALQMSEKNKVWFKDEAEARARGYTPAGNCKGLR